ALGKFALARKSYKKVLEFNPECSAAYFRLVDLIEDHGELDRFIESVEREIAKENENLRFRCQLHFAVAVGYRRRKKFDEAFSWFAAGNELRKTACRFDPDHFRRDIDCVIQGFRPEAFDALKGAGSDSKTPIFIVGVPRSGSTLVEQILSSHPQIADAGESTKFGKIVQLLGVDRGDGISYPHNVGDLSPKTLLALGDDYLNALQYQHSDHVRRVTDKQLTNIFHVGLIAILFPKAAIIHCRRDPLDTCLSCYFQNFREPKLLAWTNDLEDMGFYYREYERIADHWRDVLPGRMFEVNYEDIVADHEGMSRKLIEHVGLSWDDACLDFHKSERGVQTASAAQVRKPIYNSSIGAWRNYAKHLAPLRQALGIDDPGQSAA
ncbi:MAG: tetratricopeptide repeat-containing sulfotransferase family protein, partial [Methyloligellaceae bacterium]